MITRDGIPIEADSLSKSVSYGRVQLATSGVAQQLTSILAATGVILAADLSNGIDIYVGFSNAVTSTNYFVRLQPGDRTPLLTLANLNLVWIYGTFTTETRNITYGVF